MVLQNSLDNLNPLVIAESCENERRVAAATNVVAAEPGFEPWKHTLVMKRDNFLGDLKLLPEYCRVLELLNQVAGRLGEKCGQETDASQQGSAESARGRTIHHNHLDTKEL